MTMPSFEWNYPSSLADGKQFLTSGPSRDLHAFLADLVQVVYARLGPTAGLPSPLERPLPRRLSRGGSRPIFLQPHLQPLFGDSSESPDPASVRFWEDTLWRQETATRELAEHRLTVVRAAPGSGKSRLIAVEAARLALDGMRSLQCGTHPTDVNVPLAARCQDLVRFLPPGSTHVTSASTARPWAATCT